MRFRIWVSLVLAFSFIIMMVTGLLLFFLPYKRSIDTVHSVFGILFILAALPHVWNNIRTLSSYTLKRK